MIRGSRAIIALTVFTEAAMTEEGRAGMVPLTRDGRRIGEGHQNAKYTDREVDLVRRLRDGGMPYRRIARKMDMPLSTVWAICACEIRAEIPDHWERR